MPFKPIFLVTKFGNVGRKSKANDYTGDSEKVDLWRVGMVHGYYVGHGMDFFFETEEQASKFSLWEIYDQSQLIHNVRANETYTVEGVTKEWDYGQTNPYTDRMSRVPIWRVSMENDLGNSFLELKFPDPSQANRFSKGRPFKMQDLFGTLRAVPVDVASQVAAKAAEAKAAKEAADQARADAEAHEAADARQDEIDMEERNTLFNDAVALAAKWAAYAKAQNTLAFNYKNATGTGASAALVQYYRNLSKTASLNSQRGADEATALAAINSGAQTSASAAQISATAAASWAKQAAALAARPGASYIRLSEVGTKIVRGTTVHYYIVNGGCAAYYRPGAWAYDADVAQVIGGGENFANSYGFYYYPAGTFTNPYNGVFSGLVSDTTGGLVF